MSLDDEVRDHLERETEDNIARGMAPEEARRAGLRKFGNVTRVKEEAREVWRRVWLDQLLQDLRYGCRTLRRNPGFAAVVILTLALGIGMTTAIFSVVNAALLRPLPYPNPQRLVWLDSYDPFIKHSYIDSYDFYHWRDLGQSYTAMAAYSHQQAALATRGDARKISGLLIGGDFWRITGAHAALGRLPGPDEQGAIAISWDLFQKQFAADPRTVGSSALLDGLPVTIRGVLPKSFRFEFPAWWQATEPGPVEAYFPLTRPSTSQYSRGAQAVAALKSGSDLQRAQAELEVLEKHVFETRPNRPRGALLPKVRVEPLEQTITRSVRPALLLLLAAGVFVLLIASVNIANLLLSRATVRQRGIAIRAAVGAGRMRVMRQQLVESIVLALAGCAAGLAVARAATAMLIRLSPYAIPRLVETSVDGRVLAFAVFVSIGTGVLFGAGPVLALWRINLHDALKAGARASSGRRGTRLRKLLVACELTLATILLTGAGLMLESFWRMYARPPGFAPEKVLLMKFSLAGPQYAADSARDRYKSDLLRRLEAMPGVEATGIGNWFFIDGAPAFPSDPSRDQRHVVRMTVISPGYLKALGVPLIEGRWLRDDDGGDTVMLNQSMAREAFRDRDPIGRKLFVTDPAPTVVGLVADLKYSQLDQQAPAEIYAGFQQFLRSLAGGTIAVRTFGDPLTLAPAIRKVISGIDPSQPVYNIQTLEQALSDSIAPRRFNLFLLGSFAASALLLAIVGIYGAIAYSVAQRTREIGVRLALGAERGSVVCMVVREGMSVALAGIAAGLAAALGLAPVIAKLLYNVKPNDPWTLGAVALTLAGTALAACCGPALKAAWIDPGVALREE
jgi:predicted permease